MIDLEIPHSYTIHPLSLDLKRHFWNFKLSLACLSFGLKLTLASAVLPRGSGGCEIHRAGQ
jgi:hypothetical protein